MMMMMMMMMMMVLIENTILNKLIYDICHYMSI